MNQNHHKNSKCDTCAWFLNQNVINSERNVHMRRVQRVQLFPALHVTKKIYWKQRQHTGLTRDVGNNQNNFPFQQFCCFEATQHKIKTVNNHCFYPILYCLCLGGLWNILFGIHNKYGPGNNCYVNIFIRGCLLISTVLVSPTIVQIYPDNI